MDHSKMNHLTNGGIQNKTNWLLICAGVIAVVFIAIKVFAVSFSNVLFFGAILACPLMHILMMRNGGHKH
ncbi:MAG: DUF2933 domain-containing protein [Patescibacteria group bacterium]